MKAVAENIDLPNDGAVGEESMRKEQKKKKKAEFEIPDVQENDNAEQGEEKQKKKRKHTEVEEVAPETRRRKKDKKKNVRRVVKNKLSQSSQDGDMNLHKNALLAFTESARIFIHYLSPTANHVCRESNRQTINANDVLKALEEIEFLEFIDPLKVSLDDFRQNNASKEASAKTKGENKKRKADDKQPGLLRRKKTLKKTS